MDRIYTESDMDIVVGEVLGALTKSEKATIIGLSGDLGAGKTTLVQTLARHLGVQQQVVSPTFVIAKYYDTKDSKFQQLIHIDAYRIEDPAELVTLGWDRVVMEPNTLVVVEWPERIGTLLPSTTHRFHIEHLDNKRHIKQL